MLKKAGIVVLGATAGMLSLAPLASAGEAPHDGGHHKHKHGHAQLNDCGHSEGLVNVTCIGNNASIKDINILSEDDDDDDEGRTVQANHGGRSSGLVNVSNILNNPSISDVNVLSSEDDD